MIYTEQTKRALRLCFKAHMNQLDKGGMPYVFHPFHLAEQMQTEDEVTAALLHDVIEDTGYTLEDLRSMGFAQTVLEALALLTHDDSVPYLDYVRRIRTHPVARAVKLADLRHNSDLSRLEIVTEAAQQRLRKYAQAIEILEN